MSIGGSIGLEIVDVNFFSRMHRPARLDEKRRHMAGGTGRLAVKQGFSTSSRLGVKAPFQRVWCRKSKLVELERSQFGSNQVVFAADIAETRHGNSCCHRK